LVGYVGQPCQAAKDLLNWKHLLRPDITKIPTHVGQVGKALGIAR
jgi:hypothetical protein